MPGISNNRPTEYEKIIATFNRPYVYQRFPAMLVKARPHPKTLKPEIHDPQDPVWTAGNQITVHNEEEERRALAEGYRKTRQEALDAYESARWDKAKAAGHREYEDKDMSEPARREAAAKLAQVDGAEHVPEIPADPVRPADKARAHRGRRKT